MVEGGKLPDKRSPIIIYRKYIPAQVSGHPSILVKKKKYSNDQWNEHTSFRILYAMIKGSRDYEDLE